jgi:CIC family chloride channel protein
VITGALAGLVGGAFHLTLDWLNVQRTALVELAHERIPPSLGWAVPAAACALGAAIGVWLPRRYAPVTAGSGIPRVEAELRDHQSPVEAHVVPVKFIGGALAMGSGLALGREGPTVQIGATLGRMMADAMRKWSIEPLTLVAAGAGAGLATAFNAPLAGIVFVMEELLHRFAGRVFAATIIACIAAVLVLRSFLGAEAQFDVPAIPGPPLRFLPIFLGLGAIAALVGIAFNRSLLWTMDLFDRAPRWPRELKGASVGAAIGLIAWFAPATVGGGESLAQSAILHDEPLRVLLALLGLRALMTVCSYSCRTPGGLFAPLLAMGALLGQGCNAVAPASAGGAAMAIVGMTSLFAASVRAPLTGIALLLEMTGASSLLLPMIAATALAWLIPEMLGAKPIYDLLRDRDERSPQPGIS